VILAGPDEEPVAAAAVREGAQDYLLKGPAAAGLLARTLHNAVGRKREEEALRESEQRYRRLLDSVTDYIYTVHLDGRGRPAHTSHGPACATVTGYAADDFAADPFLWLRMVHPDDQPAVMAQGRRRRAPARASLRWSTGSSTGPARCGGCATPSCSAATGRGGRRPTTGSSATSPSASGPRPPSPPPRSATAASSRRTRLASSSPTRPAPSSTATTPSPDCSATPGRPTCAAAAPGTSTSHRPTAANPWPC
jgi:hypothetical protein